ncbi:SAM-dependent methyltransferase [Bacteroidia bacterium]|nr:SAM-dependent methyltransferase [Bacteroidia bacterium]
MAGKNIDVKEKFFFADGDSAYYDDTIELTVPYYRLIHKTMIDILHHHFKAQYGGEYKTIKGIILDVGAGTGTESISAMNEFPNMHTLAVDLCEPMKALYEQNYQKQFGDNEEKQFKYIVEDIMVVSNNDEGIQSYYKSVGQKACKVAMSAYCIHHFTFEEKKAIYQKMFDMLEPGGVLINMDLFTYESDVIRLDAHRFDIDFIIDEFDNPNFENSRKIPQEQREILKHKWVNHMETAHFLEPVEQHLRLLREIGFEDVECVLKYWQQGVIRATKSIE